MASGTKKGPVKADAEIQARRDDNSGYTSKEAPAVTISKGPYAERANVPAGPRIGRTRMAGMACARARCARACHEQLEVYGEILPSIDDIVNSCRICRSWKLTIFQHGSRLDTRFPLRLPYYHSYLLVVQLFTAIDTFSCT